MQKYFMYLDHITVKIYIKMVQKINGASAKIILEAAKWLEW